MRHEEDKFGKKTTVLKVGLALTQREAWQQLKDEWGKSPWAIEKK